MWILIPTLWTYGINALVIQIVMFCLWFWNKYMNPIIWINCIFVLLVNLITCINFIFHCLKLALLSLLHLCILIFEVNPLMFLMIVINIKYILLIITTDLPRFTYWNPSLKPLLFSFNSMPMLKDNFPLKLKASKQIGVVSIEDYYHC